MCDQFYLYQFRRIAGRNNDRIPVAGQKQKNLSTAPGKIEVTEPGTYYLILKDNSNGCTNEDTAMVEVFENEIDIALPLTIFVQEGDTVRLNTI